MDLFGPYGMFLIWFGFYVSYLVFWVLSRLILDCSSRIFLIFGFS